MSCAHDKVAVDYENPFWMTIPPHVAIRFEEKLKGIFGDEIPTEPLLAVNWVCRDCGHEGISSYRDNPSGRRVYEQDGEEQTATAVGGTT